MTNEGVGAQIPRRRLRLAAFAAVLALVSTAASDARQQKQEQTQREASSQQQRQVGREAPSAVRIKNFGRVNERYYRGAQPDPAGFAELKRLGIKTVLDLREDSKREAPEWARAEGLRYFNLPLRASRPATEEQTSQFLEMVNDPANWPVYVHCKGGRHRTGALTAVYRITHDGWTADQAYKEMLEYDFDNSIFGGGGRARQKRYVYDFYEQRRAAEGAKEEGKR